jgi:hypothetical protein
VGNGLPTITLYRGKVQMHMRGGNRKRLSIPLVHSTGLRYGSVNFGQFRTMLTRHTINGPVILLPRVGKPDKSKVVLYLGRRSFVMSDCVLAIDTCGDLRRVHSKIVREWGSISKLYKGTGARFLSLADLAERLRVFGFNVKAPEGRHFSHQSAKQIGQPEKTMTISQFQSLALELCGRNGRL